MELIMLEGVQTEASLLSGNGAMGCKLVLRKTLSLPVPYRIAFHFITYESSQKTYRGKEHSF